MSGGKLAAQCGHAYLSSFLASQQIHPDLASAYAADGLGTKVCLSAPTLEQLLWAYSAAQHLGLPCALITDHGHKAFFNGKPTVTALGIGPVTEQQAKSITRKFKLQT